jgi:hypothetical protein
MCVPHLSDDGQAALQLLTLAISVVTVVGTVAVVSTV